MIKWCCFPFHSNVYHVDMQMVGILNRFPLWRNEQYDASRKLYVGLVTPVYRTSATLDAEYLGIKQYRVEKESLVEVNCKNWIVIGHISEGLMWKIYRSREHQLCDWILNQCRSVIDTTFSKQTCENFVKTRI